MAQARMLRRDICESDSFADINDSNSQLLLCLLTAWWTDHGKMIGEPLWIKGSIVRKLEQFTIKEIERCLLRINDHTDVYWWIDERGNKWLYWPKFDNHQAISKEKKSKDLYPSPKIPKKAQDSPPQDKLIKVNISKAEMKKLPSFEILWNKYPVRVGKKEAEKHFNSTIKTEEDFNLINKALQNYLLSDRVKKGYRQNGSTWFNNWRDWVDYKESTSSPKTTNIIDDLKKETRYDPKVAESVHNEIKSMGKR